MIQYYTDAQENCGSLSLKGKGPGPAFGVASLYPR